MLDLDGFESDAELDLEEILDCVTGRVLELLGDEELREDCEVDWVELRVDEDGTE